MDWTPDRIRRFRAAGLSLSQLEFAKELGFSPRTIGNAERGTHPPSLALRRALDQAQEQASEAKRDRFLAAVENCADHGTMTHDARRVMTETFRNLDNRFGGGHTRSAVTNYLVSGVLPLLEEGRCCNHVRRELFTTRWRGALGLRVTAQRKVEEACQTASAALRIARDVRSVRAIANLADLTRRLAPNCSRG